MKKMITSNYNRNNVPSDLADMLNTFIDLTQAGGIREYYDSDPISDDFVYSDSSIICNFMALCEGVGNRLSDGDVSGAERLITNFRV